MSNTALALILGGFAAGLWLLLWVLLLIIEEEDD